MRHFPSSTAHPIGHFNSRELIITAPIFAGRMKVKELSSDEFGLLIAGDLFCFVFFFLLPCMWFFHC